MRLAETGLLSSMLHRIDCRHIRWQAKLLIAGYTSREYVCTSTYVLTGVRRYKISLFCVPTSEHHLCWPSQCLYGSTYSTYEQWLSPEREKISCCDYVLRGLSDLLALFWTCSPAQGGSSCDFFALLLLLRSSRLLSQDLGR